MGKLCLPVFIETTSSLRRENGWLSTGEREEL